MSPECCFVVIFMGDMNWQIDASAQSTLVISNPCRGSSKTLLRSMPGQFRLREICLIVCSIVVKGRNPFLLWEVLVILYNECALIVHFWKVTAMKKKKEPKKALLLKAIRRSRSRAPVGRPAVFKDKSKYDRNRAKKENRKEISQE